MMTDTQELLARFVQNGSEPAFRELLTRYLDLVYSTAVRLVDGDTHRAEDVAQIVFTDLARMASKLSASTTLGGWLHRHTCFVARTVMRGERRRQARERQAVGMNALNDSKDSVLARMAPVLDEAIQELGADDRDAILLRFFERRGLRSVGEALGINENVAQKRVSRAVQELGFLLQRRGVALSAAALASGLAAGAVTAAPTGLAASIAGSVFGGAGAAAGAGAASANVAAMAKLKLGIVAALAVAGAVTVLFLKNHSNVRLREAPRPIHQQSEQPDSADSPRSPPDSQEVAWSAPTNQLLSVRPWAPQASKPSLLPVAQPVRQSVAVPEKVVADNPFLPYQRFAGRSGSRVRIEGTSNIGDWQVESSFVGGSLELGLGFPIGSGQTLQPGPVQAQAEVFIAVRSLKSVDKDGRPYSGKMDETLYESLRERQASRIRYRLVEMSFKDATNCNGVLRYEFESRGELVVAGVTNEIAMSVSVLPLRYSELKISGRASLKMMDFQIDPPVPRTALGLIKTGDDVNLLVEWVVAPKKGTPSLSVQEGWVPLLLALPAPAFKGTPADLKLGPNVEPLSDKPRAPMMVPPGLGNIARGSKLASSVKSLPADALARITDRDKAAADGSIILLRKGTQWVQMDLGSPQEIFAVVIWHAHNAAKVYHDVIVQVADDADFAKYVGTLFNNDKDNSSGLGAGTDREYVETHEGKLINAKGVKARYLRFYSNGSTESALNEYTEIEVYGRWAK
jgi:RNA polymerase sigma factor (sigma-70 family)